ncbi:MAG: Hsp20/alpha crystallin family protein [Dehalococcoidia bacterium]
MTSVFRWDPFAEMRNSMETLFDQGFSRPWRLMSAPDYQAGFPMDVWETNDALEVRASIPGINPDDVSISLTRDSLTVGFEHPAGEDETNRRYVVREISRGKFQRTISLHTPVDPDRAEARYENGVLHLRMPKAESARVRQIRVGDSNHLLN